MSNARSSSFPHNQGKFAMEKFIHLQNLALFRKRLAEPHDDRERQILLQLLAEEEAKDLPQDQYPPQLKGH